MARKGAVGLRRPALGFRRIGRFVSTHQTLRRSRRECECLRRRIHIQRLMELLVVVELSVP
jgi:hypothetical protein